MPRFNRPSLLLALIWISATVAAQAGEPAHSTAEEGSGINLGLTHLLDALPGESLQLPPAIKSGRRASIDLLGEGTEVVESLLRGTARRIDELADTLAATDEENLPQGLEGYCPVTLAERRWLPGDPRWSNCYEARVYYFAGPHERDLFVQNPSRYAPAHSGLDAVLLVDQGVSVEGNRRHGVWYKDRIFLFSSERALERFTSNPDRYLVKPKEPTANALRPAASVSELFRSQPFESAGLRGE